MQSANLLLIPPTHEQSTPSFHVAGSLAADFLAFLEKNGVTAWQPPETLDLKGPDAQRVVEIEIEAGTPLDFLEGLVQKFLHGR
jgi:hypothetical protein